MKLMMIHSYNEYLLTTGFMPQTLLDMEGNIDKNFYLHCILLKVLCVNAMERIEKSCKVEGDC